MQLIFLFVAKNSVHPLPTDQSSNRYSHHVDAGDYYARIRFVNNSKAFDDAGQSSRKTLIVFKEKKLKISFLFRMATTHHIGVCISQSQLV